MTDTTPIIELQGVFKTYQVVEQQVQALRGVNLKVRKGQMVGITGRSGSGKSTLLHVIGTLDTPSAGVVRLNGKDVSHVSDQTASAFRNRTVGFVFQMNNLLPEFSAIENVMMPGLIAGGNRSLLRDRAIKLLQAVELGHRLDHRPAELSGGEQQRVAIARALLMEPPILLADEPTGNLDKKSGELVESLLMDLSKRNQLTMLLVTHDNELAKRLPYQVVMEDGNIVDFGGPW
ncbi:MAG TPA: ABC transporter ATP-binding protein [Oligoflexus sp.]|uniref:ABC transporter ATP-binding protein n=1 Tax=Oligoflexus sp. TaxID=1971216 RepID=UPI002D80C51E|nr:ABC transporter ATP-binding protein [Oligoflexus sp.]HET9239655.1 ABC transporter ATP-binding protein [Oligoflexus sp.]